MLVYDIVQNKTTFNRFLKKMKYFNSAVGSIIPPAVPGSNYSSTNNTSTASGSTSTSTSTSNQTFSVYDRDAPKSPLALISKHGISYSNTATPLVTLQSRLDRYAGHHEQALAGPVAWVLCQDKLGYKIVDKSTNVVIGRWRCHTTLRSMAAAKKMRRRRHSTNSSSTGTGGGRRASLDSFEGVEDEEGAEEVFGDGGMSTIGVTASNLYFSALAADQKRLLTNTPFFSGEAATRSLMSAAATVKEHDRVTWSLVVRGSIVATLKGYELNILEQRQSEPAGAVGAVYLDEFTKGLRQKHAASFDRLLSVNEDSALSSGGSPPSSPSSFLPVKKPGRASSVFSVQSTPSCPTLSPTSNSMLPPPLPPSKPFSRSNSCQSNFNRIKFTDGVIMASLALMLNLDERATTIPSIPALQEQQLQKSNTRRNSTGLDSPQPSKLRRAGMPTKVESASSPNMAALVNNSSTTTISKSIKPITSNNTTYKPSIPKSTSTSKLSTINSNKSTSSYNHHEHSSNHNNHESKHDYNDNNDNNTHAPPLKAGRLSRSKSLLGIPKLFIMKALRV